MSRRRGFSEGVLDRLLLLAVFRCLECGTRWKVKDRTLAFKKTRMSETITEYLGYGDDKGRVKFQNFIIVIILLAIIVVGVKQIQKPVTPKKIQVDATGKRVK
jgi:hypothetical protein